MAILKCKMCGGELSFVEGSEICTCDYCGTEQTLPRLDSDKKINLYDRANHFRRNNDYDKAMSIYEQILNEDNTDAEAYWSLILCRYGIEYVEDPATHKRIPTINRAQYTSIYADENYKSAIQYASPIQKRIYEDEARVIDEIQKGILEISEKEEPFDVFICYKETDENGRRTQDSVLANDLYHQLVQEGFKVFFSRITLEDKLGQEYEPYIFAALNSAKVMVVLGTKSDYFKAVWVKNEWSRYLGLIRSGAKKMLIPAYRDMDPYDLPEEFSHLQAQDMAKLGFMQDLIRGIKKIIAPTDKETTKNENVIIQQNVSNGSVATYLKRGAIALEDGEWDAANDFFEEVLNLEPENSEAYLGKWMAKLECDTLDSVASYYVEKYESSSIEKIYACDEDKEYIANIANKHIVDNYFSVKDIYALFNNAPDRVYTSNLNSIKKQKEMALNDVMSDKLFVRVERYANEEVKTKLKYLIQTITRCFDNKIDSSRKEDEINKAAKTNEYRTFIKNATVMVEKKYMVAIEKKEQDYNVLTQRFEKASELFDFSQLKTDFDKMNGFREAREYWEKCNVQIAEITRKEEEERQRLKQIATQKEKEKSRRRKLSLCIIFVFIIGTTAFGMYKYETNPKTIYNRALQCVEEGRYEDAVAIFTQIVDYSDSENQIKKTKYAEALDLKNKGSYPEAETILLELGEFEDSKDVYFIIQCEKAKEYINEGKMDKFEEVYKAYFDSWKVNPGDYSIAVSCEVNELLFEAGKKYSELGEYEKADVYINEVQTGVTNPKEYREYVDLIRNEKNANLYQSAITMMENGDYYSACIVLSECYDYENANTLFKEAEDRLLAIADVGDVVIYGRNTKPIEWIVLDVKDDEKLIICKEAFFTDEKYVKDLKGKVWAKMNLKEWLNKQVRLSMFTTTERVNIVQSSISADINPKYSIDQGKEVNEYLFLLSIDEAEKYFDSDTDRIAFGVNSTDDSENAVDYLLRTNGSDSDRIAIVNSDGTISYEGIKVSEIENWDEIGIRPAMWVKTSN